MLDKNPYKTHAELAVVCWVTQQFISVRLQKLSKIQRRWVSYVLSVDNKEEDVALRYLCRPIINENTYCIKYWLQMNIK